MSIEVKAVKPKGLGPYIAVIELKGKGKYLWHLFSADCKKIKKGYSRISGAEAMRNCEAAARRLAKKEHPAFYSYKRPEFSAAPPGEQKSMFEVGE